LRRQPRAEPLRIAGGGADLRRLLAIPAAGALRRGFPGPFGHRDGGYRSRYRIPLHLGLSAADDRGLHLRDGAERAVPGPPGLVLPGARAVAHAAARGVSRRRGRAGARAAGLILASTSSPRLV